MDFWRAIICIITVISVLPYIRCLFKRIILKKKNHKKMPQKRLPIISDTSVLVSWK